ncbi:MAG: hypothetical protein ACP5NW_00270 [Candidatus Woesearchaeota archaeon]
MIVFLVIVSNTFLSEVSALGIAPSKKIIEYSTGEQVINSRVINNEGRDVQIKISAEGELSEFVTIPASTLDIKSFEAEKEFAYIIRLPPNMTPGTKNLNIIASEINSNAQNSISGLLSMTQQLFVNVPYTGKYAEGHMSISSTVPGSPVSASINIINVGTESIGPITGTLLVRNFDGIEEHREEIRIEDMQPGESRRTDNTFILDDQGSYIVEYDIYYNDKTLNISKELTLGKYTIGLEDANVKNFRLGTVAKFEIGVSTDWNKQIEDIGGEVTITDKSGVVVGQTEIPKKTLNPGVDVITAYWDTSDIAAGEYVLSVKLFSGSDVVIKEYESKISENKILIEDSDIATGNTDRIGVADGNIGKSSSGWKYFLVLALVAVVIIKLMTMKKRQNKKLYK